MAAAAYGAVASLMHLLENLQHPSRQHLHYDRNQLRTLSKNLTFLLGFFEECSDIVCHTDDAVDLARQIAYAVDEAEEIIDYHVVDQLISYHAVDLLSQGSESPDCDEAEENIDDMVVDQLNQGSAYDEAEENDDNMVVDQLSQGSGNDVDTGLSSFRDELERVLNKIESNKRALVMINDRERAAKAPPQSKVSVPASGSSASPPTGKMNIMVGFDDRLVHIMDQLTGHEADLQIISITGMGGIGKTTLAQNVFDNRCIMDRFDLLKWITISQSYNIQEVLISLVGGSNNQNLAELGDKLRKMLYGRRYLTVMDDVWSTEIWGGLKRFFPNNKNGSRVLVTTRLSKVSVSFGSHKPYSMPFLDNETSWKLFCIKAFGKEVCPNPELEKIGKKIVECCKGLPLAISTIGGLLGKSNMTRDDWELIAKDVLKSIDNSKGDGDCSNILSLSYKHLPIYLKPCFLYMRVFHEDKEILADDLINYWVAEGYVQLKDGQTLEDVALEYLKDLIDRSLILMHELNEYTGDIWACKVHDLVRDLCMREYEKESCFVISKVGKIDNGILDDSCCLCGYREASTWIDLPQVCSTAKTLVSCFVCDVCNIVRSNRNRLRLVKVAVDHYGEECLKPTRLRYLNIMDVYDDTYVECTMLPLLWNLQFVVISDIKIELRTAIWEMPQLRHLNVRVDPPFPQTGRKDYLSLEKLESLEVVIDSWCAEGILKRIPHVKSLNISYGKRSEEFHNFAHLHKLHNLSCGNVNLEYISFPESLKALTLGNCMCPWEGMTMIGSLPNLEVLILDSTRTGPEWNPTEGEFLRLKTLSIEKSDLVRWNAEKSHFPGLEMLELVYMRSLEGIPSEIGHIDTLREIRVKDCTKSSVQSAREIVTEQQDYGNEELRLVIDGYTVL